MSRLANYLKHLNSKSQLQKATKNKKKLHEGLKQTKNCLQVRAFDGGFHENFTLQCVLGNLLKGMAFTHFQPQLRIHPGPRNAQTLRDLTGLPIYRPRPAGKGIAIGQGKTRMQLFEIDGF